MSKHTPKPDTKFTPDESLIVRYNALKNSLKSKENQIIDAQYVIDNHASVNTLYPIEDWKKLLKTLQEELKNIKCTLEKTSRLVEEKRIDPSKKAYTVAKKVAKNQSSLLLFFKTKKSTLDKNKKVHFAPGTK